MKTIPLNRGEGMVAFVDDEDFEFLNQWEWRRARNRSTFYAVRTGPWVNGKHKTIRMHRVVRGAKEGTNIDHVDGNGLNNQKNNLRYCSLMQNRHNSQKPSTNRSGFKGVCFHVWHNKYQAYITSNKIRYHLGNFSDPVDAAQAYDRASEKLNGPFAYLNFAKSGL